MHSGEDNNKEEFKAVDKVDADRPVLQCREG